MKQDTKKVFIRRWGCQMNDRDSEVIAGLLFKAGYKLVGDENDANIVIFNTCSVRQHAEDKVWSEVGRLAKKFKVSDTCRGRIGLGSVRHLKPVIGIVGCMAQNYKGEIFKRAPAVDFVVGPSDIAKIPGIIKKIQERDCFGVDTKCQHLAMTNGTGLAMTRDLKIWETDGNVRPEEIYHTGFYEDKSHAYVVISEGCSNHCSYCVVPYVRGELQDRDCKDILREIEEGVGKGITNITLLGQNVNAYLSNSKFKNQKLKSQSKIQNLEKEITFIELLKLVDEIKGLKEFSFITSHPKDASVDLFKAMAECERLKKSLHLPIQSGSNRILKLMNRGYTKKQYSALVEEYRKIIPGGTLSTDIIVGFPTETEKDFLETYELMKEVKFDSAYIFKYSPRPHTEAEKLPDDVVKEEKQRRHKILLDYQKGLHKEKDIRNNRDK